ncbi:MAG: hypothetical protein GY702_10980 [Desulfobulbaceae bacterium]|nr:hypothetical protein [Desulfobulbaceae bacterium]
MHDIILEISRMIVVGLILVFLVRGLRSKEICNAPGWQLLLFGFTLVFFGTLIDITDNFPSLDRFVVVGDTPAQAFLEKVVGYLAGFIFIAMGIREWLPQIASRQQQIAENLTKAEEEVQILQGLLPICSSCKKIRDEDGSWNQLEAYICEYSEAVFTHSLCDSCVKELYPEEYAEIQAKN